MYYRFFCNYLPLQKGLGPPFEQTWIRCFVPSLVEIGPVVLDKKIKMWSIRADRRTTDDGRSEKQKLSWANKEIFSAASVTTRSNLWTCHPCQSRSCTAKVFRIGLAYNLDNHFIIEWTNYSMQITCTWIQKTLCVVICGEYNPWEYFFFIVMMSQ